MKTPLLALVSVFIAYSFLQEASAVGCYFPRDVVFLLDTSGSVGSAAFQQNLDFVKMIVQTVISTGPGGMQIGVGTFSTVGKVEFHMNAFTQVSDVVAAVAAIPYPGGGTNIGAGINTMTTMFQSQFAYGIVEIAVGEICSGTPPCYPNSHCVLDGTNAGITRCLCDFGYIYVEDLLCARIITTSVDPNCATCETNGGVCYDASNDNTKDGCHCPGFRSGVDCQKSHATVGCDASTFTMTICYEEQAQYAAAGAVVLVEGRGMKVACKAVKVTTSGSACPVGQHQLVLPLDSSKLGTCGTKSVMTDIITRKYQNTILVQHRLQDMHMDDVSFTASCSYDTHANTIFEPVGKAVANAAEKGKHYKPTLTFYVETSPL